MCGDEPSSDDSLNCMLAYSLNDRAPVSEPDRKGSQDGLGDVAGPDQLEEPENQGRARVGMTRARCTGHARWCTSCRP